MNIDDTIVNLQLFEELFQDKYEIYSALSPRVGLEILRKEPIKLVFVDLFMPEMNGSEAIEAINEINRDVKIIISSGFHGEDITDMISKTAVKGYIQKPFRMNELSTLIHSILHLDIGGSDP